MLQRVKHDKRGRFKAVNMCSPSCSACAIAVATARTYATIRRLNEDVVVVIVKTADIVTATSRLSASCVRVDGRVRRRLARSLQRGAAQQARWRGGVAESLGERNRGGCEDNWRRLMSTGWRLCGVLGSSVSLRVRHYGITLHKALMNRYSYQNLII